MHSLLTLLYHYNHACLDQIGMMSSTSLPPRIKDFYAILAIFTLDFEFGAPGREGSSSDFLEILKFNTELLIVSVLPIVTVMPLLMILYGVLHAGRQTQKLRSDST